MLPSPEELINATIEALGKSAKTDYRITPTTHARELAERAGELAEILRTSEALVAARQYEERDQRARDARDRFGRLTSRARWAVLIAACFAVALMLAGAFAERLQIADRGWVFIALGGAGTVAGALGTMWVFRIREGKLLDEWMQHRAHAETRRLAYFALVTGCRNGSTGSGLPLRLQQLEYFRRYQLEVQVRYYRDRSAEHLAASRRTLAVSSWAVFVSTLSAGLAGVLGAWWPALASLAALSVLGSALSSFASVKESGNQDRRNAERYGRTYESLEQLESKLPAVRHAVTAGSSKALNQFVRAVHEQLSLEHRQWLRGAEAISDGVASLEETLAGLKDQTASISSCQAKQPVNAG